MQLLQILCPLIATSRDITSFMYHPITSSEPLSQNVDFHCITLCAGCVVMDYLPCPRRSGVL